MLSRRDKLLIQPWEDRRFKEHRSKVRSALPAIDDRPPPARPHVTVKLKKCQRELDRKDKIQNDNFSLLQRLNAIMNVNRLDNHWVKPPPNFHHKVGLFYDAESLQSRLTSRSLADESHDFYTNVKCYACELRKNPGVMARTRPVYSRPLIKRNSLTLKLLKVERRNCVKEINVFFLL